MKEFSENLVFLNLKFDWNYGIEVIVFESSLKCGC